MYSILCRGAQADQCRQYTVYELEHHIKTSKSRFLIVDPTLLPPVLNAAKACEIPLSNVLIFNPRGEEVPAGFRPWTVLLDHGEEDWARFDDYNTCRSTTAARLYSSGTTGLPKAAMLSHHNFISEHTLTLEHKPKPYSQSRMLALPMFHAAIAPAAHIAPLRAGHTSYVMRRFELEPYLRYMHTYQITEITIVPPMAIAIIMSPLSQKPEYSMKGTVRAALCGAAPLDKGPQARLKALLADDAPFTQVWGMTETSCIASQFYYPEHDTTGSVGRFMPNLDVKLVDDGGEDISGYDVRGELCIKGPTVVQGYFENPEANARDWDSDGYFHTGDIAYCDGNSKLWYIVDRKKELIKVRGFQVAPPEVEAVLLGHPLIVDAAVIGMPAGGASEGEGGSQLPRAYVVRRPESAEAKKLTEKDVYQYVEEKLAKFKRLDGGVVFVEDIPKNPSGKILKRLLRERAAREMGSKL